MDKPNHEQLEPIHTRLGGVSDRRDQPRAPHRRLDDRTRALLTARRVTPPAPAKRPVLSVPAGDYMQVGYDLRIALQIAEVAIGEAERAGSPAETINRLRAMVKQLRAG